VSSSLSAPERPPAVEGRVGSADLLGRLGRAQTARVRQSALGMLRDRSIPLVASACLIAATTLVACAGSTSAPTATAGGEPSLTPFPIPGVPRAVLAAVQPGLLPPFPVACCRISDTAAEATATVAATHTWTAPSALRLLGAGIARVDHVSVDWVVVFRSTSKLSSTTLCNTAKPCSGHFFVVGVDVDTGAVDTALTGQLIAGS
jgi:hypothetical protein